MTFTIPRAEIDAVMERHNDRWLGIGDPTVEDVRLSIEEMRRSRSLKLQMLAEADDLDALVDRIEREAP